MINLQKHKTMKKSFITFSFVLLAVAAQAQIKMHSNGRITFQTLLNTTAQGVSFGPAPNWNVDFNGPVYFHGNAVFMSDSGNYQWVNGVHTNYEHSVSWIVSYHTWDSITFYVYGKGDAYAKNHYTIQNVNDEKGSEAIHSKDALSIIEGLNGYYFEPKWEEIPDLENNEFVVPEAVEAMYADFEKRTAGLSGSNLESVFPEAVRTDMKNRYCIDYQSVVTMLVEAVKEQQREREELRTALEKVGKNK